MGYKVAIMGATGSVGYQMLSILAERNFPVGEVVALASKESVGKQVTFGEGPVLDVRDTAEFDFADTDIVLASAGGKVAAKFAEYVTAAGAILIDNSSHFRMDPEVPLVVPEVNPEALENYDRKNIVANPNCSTIQMVMALKPLHDLAGIKRVVVSTYQSVSGAGRGAMDELFNQTRSVYMNAQTAPEQFPKPIAFNVIPQIDVFMKDGSTKEEWKMVGETQKILGNEVEVCATCVRVPVFVGHAEAINVEFESPITAKDARRALLKAPGIRVVDNIEEEQFVTPVEVATEDDVYISRIREDKSVENGLSLWVVADNLRKGAALNAVQIAEQLVSDYL